MQAYEGYFENGRFYLLEKTEHMKIKGRRRAFVTILDEQVKKSRSESRGVFKGKIRMADDFDEPLEELKEYME